MDNTTCKPSARLQWRVGACAEHMQCQRLGRASCGQLMGAALLSLERSAVATAVASNGVKPAVDGSKTGAAGGATAAPLPLALASDGG
jgi:hypothetical protein